MVREIQTFFPGDGVAAEEAGGRLGVDREFVWALDPIDGTNTHRRGRVPLALKLARADNAGIVLVMVTTVHPMPSPRRWTRS